jgi:hypothetical protein
MAGGGRASVGGRDLRCKHCDHELFYHQTARLDRVAWGGLLHFEGVFGQHTDVYTCAGCGFAHLFMPVATPPAQPRPEERPPEEACLSCGMSIPGDAGKCPACGWTWSADVGGKE